MKTQFWDYYDRLLYTSEVRAKADPRTQWYIPRGTDLEEYFASKAGDYAYIDMRNIPFNKCKEILDSVKCKKVAIHSYFDKTASSLLANNARLNGFKVVIEFLEHASEILDAA